MKSKKQHTQDSHTHDADWNPRQPPDGENDQSEADQQEPESAACDDPSKEKVSGENPFSGNPAIIGVSRHEEGPRPVRPPSTEALFSVALYLRVSTEDQDLAGQRRELETEATRKGWTVAAVYEEKVSGTGKVVRTEYERLLKDSGVPDRPWTHLLVWSLDRFSREATFTKATQTILDLEAAGIRFHSLKDPTLDTPDDGKPNLGRDVLLALLPVISAFESKRRSERVRVAMREIKSGHRRTRSGRPPGRPRRVTPKLEARILALRAERLPWKTIAQRVQLPSGTCRKVRAER